MTVRVHRFTTCEKILVVTAKVFCLVVSFDACFGLAEKDLLEQDETINSEVDDGVFEVYFNLISFRFLSRSHDSSLMMEVTKIRPLLSLSPGNLFCFSSKTRLHREQICYFLLLNNDYNSTHVICVSNSRFRLKMNKKRTHFGARC